MARIPGEFRHGVEVGVEVLSRYPGLCLDQGESNEGFHSAPKPFRMIGMSLVMNWRVSRKYKAETI
jgi:hypothetical protein